MLTRRKFLVAGSIAGAAAFSGGLAWSNYRSDLANARQSVSAGYSKIIASRFGDLEYAEAGQGKPVLMAHGTGGGFDQGLLFARPLVAAGYRVVAPSRFGYLRSAMPDEPSSDNQADAFADLLDALAIERVAIIGGSAVARGRDAADVPLINSFGPHTLKSFRVWTYDVTDMQGS